MKLKLLSVLTTSVLLAACGSGSDGTVSESSHPSYDANAPKGPASYTYYASIDQQGEIANQASSILNASSMNYFNAIGLDNAPGASCSSAGKVPVFSIFKNTVSFINVFEPELDPVTKALGAINNINTIYGDAQGISGTSNLCIENQISAIYGALQSIQTELSRVNEIMELTDTFIMDEIASNAQSDLAIAYNNYLANVHKMIGTGATPGVFDQIMMIANIPTANSGEKTGMEVFVENPGNVLLTALEYAAHAPSISQDLFDLSGTTYARDACALSDESCQGMIEASNEVNSSLILLLNLSYKYLQDEIALALQGNINHPDNPTNIIQLYDEYNNFITSLYHLSLVPISEIYYLERIANQINLLGADYISLSQHSYLVELPTLSYVPRTHYRVTYANDNASAAELESLANKNIDDYNAAQTNLNLFYAGIVNQLYQNITNYIVSDLPIPGQLSTSEENLWVGNNDGFKLPYTDGDGNKKYYTIVNQINYDNIIATKSFHPRDYIAGETGFKFSLNSDLNPNTVFYQAPQIRDINACMNYFTDSISKNLTFEEYQNGLNDKTCPSFFPELTESNTAIFTAGNPEYKDGMIVPLYIDINKPKESMQVLYEQMYGVYYACQTDSELVTYTPTIQGTIAEVGKHYLTCRLWKSSAEFRDETAIGAAWTGVPETVGTQLNTSQESMANWGSGWTQILSPRPSGNSDLPRLSNWYITDVSNLIDAPYVTKNKDDTADPYFKVYGGTRSIVNEFGFSWTDHLNPWYESYSFSMGNMAQNYKSNQDSTVHMLAVSAEIDGFYYPLVYQFWNRLGREGNGFAIVQNNIINDVGFYVKDSETNQITKVPLASSSLSYSPYSLPIQNSCIGGGSAAWDNWNGSSQSYSNLSYAANQPLPQFPINTVINNVHFNINGNLTMWNMTACSNHFDRGAEWLPNSMYVEYSL